RPHTFRFQAVRVANGKERDKTVVWSDGKKTWLYDCDGCVSERGLGNALRLISDSSGYETELVPGLLLPADFGGPTIEISGREIFIAGMPVGAQIVGEENLSGRDS